MSPYSLSRPGGVQTHVLGLAVELSRRGHIVHVLAPCEGTPPSPLVDPAGPVLPVRANGSIAPLALSLGAARVSARWARRRRLDVVHVHEPLSPMVSLVVTATSDAPIVATFHAAADRWWPYETFGWALAKVIDRASVRTAVSDAAEALAARHFPAVYHRTPNGLDVHRFSDCSPDPSAPAVLFVGRNEPRKGAQVLIEAASSIDAEIGIVGMGFEGVAAPANVRFIPTDERTKPGLLKGARVFCAPALFGESFGFVVLEAMAAGCAVVASDIPGYRAAVGDAAVLVRPGDAPALAKAVNGLLADPGDLPQRAEARAQEFSWETLADRVEQVYALAV